MSRWIVSMGALVVAAGCGGSPEPHDTSSTEPTAFAAPTSTGGEDTDAVEPADAGADRLTFAEALAKGRELRPDGVPIEVEVEIDEDGNELMEVELIIDGEVRELYLHPITGELVREATEELEEAEQASLPTLEEKLSAGEATLERAIELALGRYDAGSIREIELEMHGETLVLEVEVRDGDEMVEYVLDPQSGEVQGRETDDETHEVEPGT